MRARRVVIFIASLALIAFAVYLRVLYGQLKEAFYRQDQFVPTRIYSDVARIAPPQFRVLIEEKLKSLGYRYTSSDTSDSFTLHAADYPLYLIPDNHPQVDVLSHPEQPGAETRRTVTLNFSGDGKDDVLQSIQLGGNEIPDLYLEPELVTTFSRGSGPGSPKQIRSYVKFEDIPANIWKAIISIEDQHFLEHKGLDPRGMARAIYVNLRTLSFAQGGSTITQQLVKNLMARHSKNVVLKINEVFLSLLLEATFDKEQILERYLNEVYLGQIGSYEIHGVAEGAEHFFGKELGDLNLAETAMMAGLIRGPGYYSPYRYFDRANERKKLVLKKMVETGQIAEAEAQAALKMPIRLAAPSTVANKAPYFTDFVKAELIRQLKSKMTEQEVTEAGFRVYTTLDTMMNSIAQTAVATGITSLEKAKKLGPSDRLEGALAAVDQSNGYIRALIGGRNYAQSNFNRILNMKRQVGSTFKPIVYLTAFLKGADPQGVPYSPAHPIDDSPWTLKFDHGRQSWSPKNYEPEYLGWISYRTALANSINTAAARLGHELGTPDIIKTARTLGIESDLPSVPSLALGVAELSPIELLRAYATFANHGAQDEPTVIRAITEEDGTAYARFVYNPKQILPDAPVDLLADMMTSVFTEGTASGAANMNFDRPAAGKTGTTSHHRDAWFAGFTPQLTTVVWVGMDQPHADSKVNLTGATSALPIWVDFMKHALKGDPPAPFPISPSLSNLTVDRHTGLKADTICPPSQLVTDKFQSGIEPRLTSCANAWPASVHEVVDP